jgi:hypothetical protein
MKVQVVSRRPLTAKVRVRSRTSPRKVFGGQNEYLRFHDDPLTPQTHYVLIALYQKHKCAKPAFLQCNVLSNIAGNWTDNYIQAAV